MNEKILNIKISETDFDMIKRAIIIAIQKCNENIKNPILDKEDVFNLEEDILKYKKIITKLNVCKLYND